MFFFWIELAAACIFGLLGIWGIFHVYAVAYLLLFGFSMFAGAALNEWLKLHGHPRSTRQKFSIVIVILLLVGSFGLVKFGPLVTPTNDKSSISGPLISIMGSKVHPYEVGQRMKVDLLLENRGLDPLMLRGITKVFVGSGIDPIHSEDLQDKAWSEMIALAPTVTEKLMDYSIPPLSKNTIVTLEAHVFTREQVSDLQIGKTAALFFMGVMTYTGSDKQFQKIEFCGFYLNRTEVMYGCTNHSEHLMKRPRRQ